MAKKIISGTKEWAAVTLNLPQTGCPHGCVYCYAAHNACDWFKRVRRKDWRNPAVREPKSYARFHKKYPGTIFFPSAHDITPKNLWVYTRALDHLLFANNRVLIVTKPHLQCISSLTTRFWQWREQIMFRFTIGAMDDAVLKLWEPGAPSFKERRDCLILARQSGYRTSVSAEPLLDPPRADHLFRVLEPDITDTFWIGKLNHIETRVHANTPELKQAVAWLKERQTDEWVNLVYHCLKEQPKVRWKESYKKVLGLPLAEKAGEDK